MVASPRSGRASRAATDMGHQRYKLSGVIGSGSVRIRRAEPRDERILLSLAESFATSFIIEPVRFSMQLEAILADRASALLVAESADGVIGYVAASVHPTLYANGRVGWIEELMVDPGQRRGGVGRLLVSAAEGWIEAQDAVMVALATRRASDFWLAIGYEESATYFRKLL
jgi:GNAT superfamily N-acetyltransferase